MDYVIQDIKSTAKFDWVFDHLVKRLTSIKLLLCDGGPMSEHNLDYKTDISEETCTQMTLVRAAAMVLEKQIADSCKTCRETSIAFTKLEEALMWAIKSLAVHGHEIPLGELIAPYEEVPESVMEPAYFEPTE